MRGRAAARAGLHSGQKRSRGKGVARAVLQSGQLLRLGSSGRLSAAAVFSVARSSNLHIVGRDR